MHLRARSSHKCLGPSGGGLCPDQSSKLSSQLHRTDTETVLPQERGGGVRMRGRSSCKCSTSSGEKLRPSQPNRPSSQLHRTDTETVVVQEREGGAYEGQEQLRVFKLFRRKFVS